MDCKAQIREFVVSDLLYGDDASIEDTSSFLESGLIDSTGMLAIILFLERTFQLTIAPEEMVPANLDSIERLCAFLERKLAEQTKSVCNADK